MIERHYKTAELAALLGLHPETIRRAGEHGEIERVRVGSDFIYPQSAIEAWVGMPLDEAAALALRNLLDEPVWIYFVQAGSEGPIKIGIACDPRQRFFVLQSANPTELLPLGRYLGTPAEEKRLHAEFAAHRIRGEWFEPTRALLDRISEFMLPWRLA